MSPSPILPKVFLGSLVALIVARPFVSGNDPGHLRLTSGNGEITLNLLTWILLLAWSSWRIITRRSFVWGGWISIGLACLVGILLVSTIFAASYQRPAWFITWQWATILAQFFLLRQLSEGIGATPGLIAILMATGVSIAAQGCYQQLSTPFGLPSGEMPTLEKMPLLVGDEEFNIPINQPHSPQGNARGPFFQSETLAAFLLLLLPVGIYSGLVGWRQKTIQSKGIVLLAILMGLGLLVTIPGFLDLSFDQRITSATSGIKLFTENFGLGIGPGNYSRNVLDGRAGPHSSWTWLATWTGFLGPLLLLITFAIFWSQIRKPLNSSLPNEVKLAPSLRLIFYSGGVAGLLLGFMLSTTDIPAEAPPSVILQLGAVAATRSLVWFAAFALLEGIVWQRKPLIQALGFGVALTVLFGAFSDSVLDSSIASVLWYLMALALNLQEERSVVESQSQPIQKGAYLLAGIALVLLVLNIALVAYPCIKSTSAVRSARNASRLLPELVRDVSLNTGHQQIQAMYRVEGFLVANVYGPLHQAVPNDPTNAPLLLEASRWGRMLWEYSLRLQKPELAASMTKEILVDNDRAAKLDPLNPTCHEAQIRALLLFIDQSKSLREERVRLIDKAISALIAKQPEREVTLRSDLLHTLLTIYEKPKVKQTQDEKDQLRAMLEPLAIKVLTLDQIEGAPFGRLSDTQREQFIQRLTIALWQPVPELKKLLRIE